MSTTNFPQLPVKVKKKNQSQSLTGASWLPNGEIKQMQMFPLSQINIGHNNLQASMAIVQATNEDAIWLLERLFPTWETFSDEEKQNYISRTYRMPGRYEFYDSDKFETRYRKAGDCFKRKINPGERHFCAWVLLNQDTKLEPPIMMGAWEGISLTNPRLKSYHEQSWPRPMQICLLQDIFVGFQIYGTD